MRVRIRTARFVATELRNFAELILPLSRLNGILSHLESLYRYSNVFIAFNTIIE